VANEIYVSTDTETDGSIPGPHSMLSLGSAVYTANKELIATFSANLEALPGAQGDPKTMQWWAEHPDAWEACRANQQPPAKVMQDYYNWVKALPGVPIFVGYPAAFDFMFVYWYLVKFVGESPFGHSALDIRSYAMAYLQKNYGESGKKNLPTEWFAELPLTHVALDDALQQGTLFCNLLAANLQRQ